MESWFLQAEKAVMGSHYRTIPIKGYEYEDENGSRDCEFLFGLTFSPE